MTKISLLSLILWLGACASTEAKKSTVASKNVYENVFVDGLKCSSRNLDCSTETAVTHCVTTLKYDGDDQKVIHTWGRNRCDAETKLSLVLCLAKAKTPQKISHRCTPDPSNGACASANSSCSLTPFEKKVACVATRYEDQTLGEGQQIRSEGENSCIAKKRLRELACEMNLNPTELKDIKCI